MPENTHADQAAIGEAPLSQGERAAAERGERPKDLRQLHEDQDCEARWTDLLEVQSASMRKVPVPEAVFDHLLPNLAEAIEDRPGRLLMAAPDRR